MFKKSQIWILVLFLAAPAAYAGCHNAIDLINARANLIDKQHRLEEARDNTNQRIAQLQQQLDAAQNHMDKLNTEILNLRRAIVDMDKAIAAI
jgi:TolA-binding protein